MAFPRYHTPAGADSHKKKPCGMDARNDCVCVPIAGSKSVRSARAISEGNEGKKVVLRVFPENQRLFTTSLMDFTSLTVHFRTVSSAAATTLLFSFS